MIKSVRDYLSLIKFSHSVFALPFALVTMIIALQGYNSGKMILEIVILIIIAMVSARSGAMGFNRLVDIKWDSQNPRTATRPSATGAVGTGQMIIMILISFAILVYVAWRLNPLAFKLSPVAIFLVCFYSYTKRFTTYAHLFLGLAIGSAPVASWIAVTGEISLVSLFFGLSVLTWIAGFDIIYSLQDVDFDSRVKLHSIPVRFGIVRSIYIARSLHILTIVLWFTVPGFAKLSTVYYLGALICSCLLIYEHRLVSPGDLSKLNVAFFNMNSIISITMFMAVFGDVILVPWLIN
ncbi:MAG: UbiA family prenyltransferase [Deltaproteobacteria bacterium]|jgi:4-hydroxybenzoate polyprenyltransferase|nr:UbiA family prenyltransferase [Deltaproteobacteria bacterium]MBT4525780.1 UbiA family prenyltransferase [Deltaproteobacteria bacterium]